MSALIRVVLSQQQLQIEPGQRGEFSVTIQNLGETVDEYSVELKGLSPSWYTIPITRISLFPQEQETVRISLHPPVGPEAKSGKHDFMVEVGSREVGTDRTEASATLEILSDAGLELELSPQKASTIWRGVYQVRLSNPGNTDLDVRLSAVDPEEACQYRFESPAVSLGAGQSEEVSLTVSPTLNPFMREVRNYEFTVRASPTSTPTAARVVKGMLEHRPLLPKWGLPAGIIALLLLCCGTALAVGISTFGGDITGLLAGLRGPTPTPWQVVYTTQTVEAAALQAALSITQTAQVQAFAATQTAAVAANAATQTMVAESMGAAQTASATATETAAAPAEATATALSPVRSVTPIPTVVPTKPPTPVPPPSPTPGPSPTPTATPTPCPLATDGFFYPAWLGVRDRVGCPVSPGDMLWSAEEQFERGHMIWREDTRYVYAVYDDGTWQGFIDDWQEVEPEYSCLDIAPPDTPPTPKRGFGKIWCLNPPVKDKLGWAEGEEKGGSRSVQDFARGVMIGTGFAGTVILYDDGTWHTY